MTRAVSPVLLLCIAASVMAQTPVQGTVPAGPGQQAQPITPAQTPPFDTFNGSALLDKPVPSVIQLSILDAIQRGLRHNLGLLLSQQQTDAARAEHRRNLSALLPNVSAGVSYGVNQINLAAFGIPVPQNLTSLAGGVNVPIFQGGRVKADIALAEASLRQTLMQLEDLHNRVELEVRSSWQDVKTSNEQVAVGRQSIVLAAEQLKEAQDRFGAGVAGSLEVVQAQEAVANTNETFIEALYLNNVAKLSLAHALGVAEQQTKAFLGGK